MYVIMNLMHLVSQISRSQHANSYFFTLTTHTQVVGTYWMIWCQLGHNQEK